MPREGSGASPRARAGMREKVLVCNYWPLAGCACNGRALTVELWEGHRYSCRSGGFAVAYTFLCNCLSASQPFWQVVTSRVRLVFLNGAGFLRRPCNCRPSRARTTQCTSYTPRTVLRLGLIRFSKRYSWTRCGATPLWDNHQQKFLGPWRGIVIYQTLLSACAYALARALIFHEGSGHQTTLSDLLRPRAKA